MVCDVEGAPHEISGLVGDGEEQTSILLLTNYTDTKLVNVHVGAGHLPSSVCDQR